MTFLSLLEIDSQAHIARTWLGNPYRVHQRLAMAFPMGSQGGCSFASKTNGHRRGSSSRAKWSAIGTLLFGSSRACLTAAAEAAGHHGQLGRDTLRFRLLANPTKRLSAGCPGAKVDGRRVGLFKEAEQRDWLERKAAAAGFAPLGVEVRPLSTIVSHKNPSKDRSRQSHLAVQFDGRLRVTDPGRLSEAVQAGIGTAKAYGFGLLSLASVTGHGRSPQAASISATH